MDLYQIRALELEIEQLERFKETAPEMKEHFFKERFERTIADEIGRYRRMSTTYRCHYER
jgi:hypothetical protein